MRLRLICSAAGLALVLAAAPVLAQEAPPTPAEDAVVPAPDPITATPPEVPLDGTPVTEITPEPVPETDPGPPNLNGGSSYGRFLAGRMALNAGDSQESSRLLFSALSDGSGERLPRERAFSAAILAGDIEAASRIQLTAGESQPAIVEAARLAQMVVAFDGRREARRMREILALQPIAAPHAWVAGLLDRWLAAEAGDWDAATAAPDASADAFTQLFSTWHRAELLEIRRRYDESDALYQQLMLNGTAAPLYRLPYGEFLERRGRRDEAVAVYDAGLALGDNPTWAAARARAMSGGRPPEAPTVRTGAAAALYQASAFAIQAEAHEFAVAYLRMSLSLDDTQGDAWALLAETLDQINMPTTAREAWASTPRGSPAYLQSRVQLALNLDEAGETEEALRVAREAVGEQGDVTAAYALASLLVSHEEYEASLAVLDGPVLSSITDWNLLFLRGAANERLERHDAAQAAFEQALSLAPDQPEILNYLGYLWIDQGSRVEEGIAMVERAVAAEPTSGAYQDSLGWGQYRLGRYDEAVVTLEHAVTLDAGSATINDHLGDAYWIVGREREARFQWNRVLTLDPDDETRALAEAKLTGQSLPVRGGEPTPTA